MVQYTDDLKEEVRSANDIVDVISQYVTLKRSGRNFFGLCPFHKEKSPSFSVSPDKQIFHCFGCGVGGNVFSFIMIILPLYPNQIDDYIYSVNLFHYTQTAVFNLVIMWSFYVALMVVGIGKVLLTQFNIEKGQKLVTNISLVLGVLAVLYLAMTRDAYAITVVFVLLIMKVMLLFKVNGR